jgi:hypothetical protein
MILLKKDQLQGAKIRPTLVGSITIDIEQFRPTKHCCFQQSSLLPNARSVALYCQQTLFRFWFRCQSHPGTSHMGENKFVGETVHYQLCRCHQVKMMPIKKLTI